MSPLGDERLALTGVGNQECPLRYLPTQPVRKGRRSLPVLRLDAATGIAEPPQTSRGISTRHDESVLHYGTMRLDVATNGDTARKNACATKAKGPGYGRRPTDL